jgi:phosphatidylserine synthase
MADELRAERRKGPVEHVIDTLASGMGNGVGWLAEHGVLFAIFAVMWAAVVAGLVLSQGTVDQTWETIRGLPIVVQAVVWLLFLPVMAGLLIWESAWPLVVRIVLVASLAGWNLLVLLPKAAQTVRT